MNDQEQITETTNDARAGTTPHIVRYVLAISMVLVIVAFAIIVGMGSFG